MTTAPIHIAARKWFDRRNGNTYHSVTVYQAGKIIAEAPYCYGYGDQYLETAANLIEHAADVEPRRQHANGSREALHAWAERVGLVYSVDCVEVMRKKDL